MQQSFSKIDQLKFKEFLELKDETGNVENILIKKANKYIGYLKKVPGIKMVAIGNSVAMNNATKESDIDLFIVTGPKRIWLVRILVIIFFFLIGERKSKNKHAGKFCLSFFTTTNGMNFGDFAVENDIYLYFWIVYLKPILNFDNTFENFININRSWADFTEFENIIEANKKYIRYEGTSIGNKSMILNIINKILRNIFIKRTYSKYEKLGKPYGIVISKDILKFHDDDKRIEVREKIFPREE